MEKENFSEFIKTIENKSDEELADYLLTEHHSKRDAIKALLDSKVIKNIKLLTKTIEKNNLKTEKYNDVLTKLTRWIFIFTVVMTIATIISLLK